MAKFMCSICGLYFPSETQQNSHFSGRKHLLQAAKLRTAEHSVYVTGFSHGTSKVELYNYFSQFGKVRDVILDEIRGSFAFVEFVNKDTVNAVLYPRLIHYFKGRNLLVKKRDIPSIKQQSQKSFSMQDDVVPHKNLILHLHNCSSVQVQMEKLCATLSLSNKDIRNRVDLCKSLEIVLRPFFCNCNIQMYGSSSNGYGFRGCDVDLLFQTTNDSHEMVSSDTPLDKCISDAPSVEDVISGRVPPKLLLQLPKHTQLRFICKVLRKYSQECKAPIFIPARCPIIKFVNLKYRVKCDLSYGNRLSLYNTHLLHLFGKLDNRITPLMMTLRYWGKHLELIGSGHKFSSYAFSLLVVFFLQRKNPPVLPTVDYLRSKTDFVRIEDGWNCSFCDEVDKIQPSANTQNIEELLKEFFSFYLHFDFTLHVVCPLSGHTIPKGNFVSNESSSNKNFKISPICVQDPFDLSHNVTGQVNDHVLVTFLEKLQKACDLYEQKIFWTPGPYNWGIPLLLDDMSIDDSTVVANSCLSSSFEILLKTKMVENLVKELKEYDPVKCDLKQLWLQKACQTVLDVLSYGLLFECEVVNKLEVTQQGKRKCDSITYELSNSKKMMLKNVNEDDVLEQLPDPSESCVKPVISLKTEDFENENNLPTPGNINGEGSKAQDSSMKLTADYFDFNGAESIRKDCNQKSLLTVQCSVYHRTWTGRKSMKKVHFPQNILDDYLETEHSISMDIIKQTSSTSKQKLLFSFWCECHEVQKGMLTALLVTLKPVTETKEFSSITSFLKAFVPKVVERLL